jgi:Zn-dependent protease
MLGIFNNPISFLFRACSFLVAITVHEYAHAWISDRLGDPTAKLMGRLSFNPFKHLDLIGTLLILFAGIGWAKPVMIDPFNLRNPKRDTAYIAFAGPIANLCTAIVLSVIYTLLSRFLVVSSLFSILFVFLEYTIVMNVSLAIFNLIPIHPLDGYSVVGGFLSGEKAQQWHELQRYGILFLLFLIFPFGNGPSPISLLTTPVTSFILSILLPSGGI